ncbi:hypothetical protein J3D55_003109 [Chryseobacterium ginsenosidimutans]|uniref:hypothetical protein n=1 Tax=Chryseobacterium ginsenosidimutans TaxID=687846 RepID=UPI0021680678|nr:hypothetical protein [Chryseobacterium ginsenosidimutans]MCS3870193.1 hypothetical protein [Chryseobacterium ginsenosidimutans]
MSNKLLPILLFLSTFSNFQAQDKAESALEIFTEKYPQEKVHLVFNKNSYVAGENIWFKSFVFDGYSPSTISTSLFVELYDRNKTQISKKLVPLINGEGSGNFTLPDNLKEDIYYVRAYTTWMTNFNEDFQALRPITVYNPSSPQKLVIDSNSRWTASVFPESGTFVDGINTKFAVRLQSKGLPPSDWNGYIVDTAKPDVKITSFKGFDQNVGSFSLTPKAGAKYQLIVDDSKGNKQTIDLPNVSDSGINLQVINTNDAVKFALKSKNIAPGTLYKVIATISNQLVFKVKSNKILEKTYSIPANQLINGVLQFTVFDDKENIVAQRLCFVQPDVLKIKKPEIQSLSLNESPRASNSFGIPQTSDGRAYTVLVLDGNSDSSEDENSLLSTLWLTGDITSKIYTPSQYFTKNHNSDALDALLISEKWKRFDWKTIMSGTYPIIGNKPQSYISYKGKVSVQGKPAPNTDLNLLFEMPNQGVKFYQQKTDANGFFSLNSLFFEDAIKFSYQLNDPKIPKEQVQVIFQPNYAFVPYKKSLPESNYNLVQRTNEDKPTAQIERYLTTKNNQSLINEKATLIEEVKLKGVRKNKTQELNEKLSGPLFQSANDMIFDFVNDNNSAQGSVNILQWLQGRVAGLTIESNMGEFIPKLRGSEISIYLDEMKVDPSQINSISTSDIAMVKVMKGFFAGGFGGGNGAIAIYTKRGGITGSVSNSTAPTKLKQITLNGFDKETPFVSPVYGDEGFNNISKDFRNVLYWNPSLQTQSKEPVQVQFFNNDDAKNYKVIIMGYDEKDYTPIYYNEIIK